LENRVQRWQSVAAIQKIIPHGSHDVDVRIVYELAKQAGKTPLFLSGVCVNSSSNWSTTSSACWNLPRHRDTTAFYGENLTTSERFWIADAPPVKEFTTGPRVGIHYAGEPWVSMPWRYNCSLI
ncbi:MAG: hypothetical protein R6V75_07590, partial [Bacteroidales bacterium]